MGPNTAQAKREIRVVPNAQAIFQAAADEFVKAAAEAVKAKGSFTVALSGGSTPKGLFSLLVTDAGLRAQVPWEKVQFFWGDERHVTPDHSDSNFRMANEAMLSKVPAKQVFRIKGEYEDAGKAADEYEQVLRDTFKLAPGQLPRFDLVLLGMGPDGHTASLFPGTKALAEKKRLVVSNWVGKFYTDRITMTAAVLNNAATVMFMAGGDDKQQPLKAVLEGPYEPEQLPSQLIQPTNGRLIWLVDQAAARMLATPIK